MKRKVYRWGVGVLCGWALNVGAAQTVEFHDPALQSRYAQLVDSLRCPKCENQAIGSSSAPVAVDMRRHVAAWLSKGYSDERIQDELVARFGEYVLYQPRLSSRTLLLWAGPAVLGVLAAGGIILTVRSRRYPIQAEPLDPDEQALLQRVLARHPDDERKEHRA
ncbi:MULTISPECIES: cytochrome c-type biogenesis protein CcmH [unclassified Zymobacter]|uniref:cytochrome c-type biogenesis protein n=1 Tax=unclassified Zymobacter TaxID=3048685 RepID=UPI0039C1B24E